MTVEIIFESTRNRHFNAFAINTRTKLTYQERAQHVEGDEVRESHA